MSVSKPRYFARRDFQRLIDVLLDCGYQCLGPQEKDGAIQYLPLDQVASLPQGYRDVQSPARYQLQTTDSPRYFSWANGPQALKPLVFAPRESLWHSKRDADGRLQFVETIPEPTPLAVIGVRSCDLAGLTIQDRVFLHGDKHDPYYAARRENLLLVAVNCSHPAETCFCTATGNGPVAEAGTGFDLLLTELNDGYLLQAGSTRGEQVAAQLPLTDANDQMHYEAGQQRLAAEQTMSRQLPALNIKKSLLQHQEHPQWEAIAERCLSCGNCTMVCPTCFCHAEQEQPQLDGEASVHERVWDSCFTVGHSYIHGMVFRQETKHRYRQWLTHKFSTWHGQFDSSGCVGCGRCISWCPAGIDVTEELAVICKEQPDA